ncbi:hypothetical protein KBX06_15490 [Micromonospora sp. C31]|uniref:hypothetical protein n=1 Tax=Micromonospora sp. C31 TaxID=2824876 RepID=UPI001B38032A|nr:hypothetical protein [Micromonospora sp. C31]MBQ1074559.1 hypothetical protein [Micromonospora sp. C31]
MRARRLVAVASVALGLVALSGCRTEPGVAAYVGDLRITEDAVTEVVDDLRAKNPRPTGQPEASEGRPPAQVPPLPDRGEVVSVLVLAEVCERVSADKNYQPGGQVAPEQVAQQRGLSPATGFVRQLADLYNCMTGVPPTGAATQPSAQELADVVAAGRRAGVIPADMSDEEAASRLDGNELRAALATRKSLAEVVAAYDVTVNPRYRPLEFPLLAFSGNAPAVSVPLGETGSDGVTDVSTPDPLPNPGPQAAGGTDS